MRNKWISHGLKAALVLITGGSILLGTAFSSWNNLKSVQGDSNSIGDSSLVAVCYITNTKGTTYYTDLTRALYDANTNNLADQIYVIPSLKNSSYVSSGYNFTEVTISENRAINAQDTLNLPFDGETTFQQSDVETTLFGDSNANQMKSNWKTDVVINENVTLTVNGTINIGGTVFVSGGQWVQGHTSGAYAQISMKANSKIVVGSGGVVNVYGYIKEYNEGNSADVLLDVRSGGKINTPLVFYDFKGGRDTLKIYSSGAGVDGYTTAYNYVMHNDYTDPGVFPINIFDFPNNQVKLKFNKGATWMSFSDFYAFDQHNNINNLTLASSGSDAVFALTGGDDEYFTADYTPTTTVTFSDGRKVAVTISDVSHAVNLTISNPIYTYWDFHCSATFNNITLLNAINFVKTLSVSTIGKFLPFSYKFQIDVSSGTITTAADIKVMYGGKIHVHKGASLIANSSIIAYDSSMNVNGTASTTWRDLAGSRGYPLHSVLGDALLINDGTVTINGSLGGRIRTTCSDGSALLSFGSSNSYSTTSQEYSGTSEEIDIFVTDPIEFGTAMNVINTSKVTMNGTLTDLSSTISTNYISSTTVDTLLSDDTTTYYEWEVYVSPIRQVTINYPYSEYTSALGVTFTVTADGNTYTQDNFSTSTRAITIATTEVNDTISITNIANVAAVTRNNNETSSSPSSYSYTIVETDGAISLEIIPMTTITLTYTGNGNMNTSDSSIWSEWREANLYVTIKVVGPEHSSLELSTDYSKYSSLQSDPDFYEVDNTRSTSNVSSGDVVVGTEMKLTFYAKGYGTGSRNWTDFKIIATTTSFNRMLTIRMYSRDGGSTVTPTLGDQGRNQFNLKNNGDLRRFWL